MFFFCFLSQRYLKRWVIPFTNMNMNTQYVWYMRHEQASVNRWIGKWVKKKKNPLENLKNHLWGSSCSGKVISRFKFFKGTSKRFCRNIPERLLHAYTFQWHLLDIFGYFSLAEIHQTISFSMCKKVSPCVSQSVY